MNSFNHYAYGAVAEWMYGGMCGIRPDEDAPGFARFVLHPTPDVWQHRINRAGAAYRSVHGTIESSWQWQDGVYEYRFLIPEGTCAKVSLLGGSSMELNGKATSPQALGACVEDGRLVFSLEAGSYQIRISE